LAFVSVTLFNDWKYHVMMKLFGTVPESLAFKVRSWPADTDGELALIFREIESLMCSSSSFRDSKRFLPQ
jgi:hypothetical protein